MSIISIISNNTKRFLSKFIILFFSIKGFFFKFLIDTGILSIPKLNENGTNNIVISLTSYGRRVRNNVVYYTIVSILRQKSQPNRIILWLAEDEWNESNLPSRIKSLQTKGVEILFCEDIKSYKKLIPTLNLCKGTDIITIDDDIIYSSDTIESMELIHNQYPADILCCRAVVPRYYNGRPDNYALWKEVKSYKEGQDLFPIGAGAIYYPSGCFINDISRKDLYMKLCPTADDIWFWFCGLMNGTRRRFVNKSRHDMSFDDIYQYLHKGSALTHSNRLQQKNDIQFRLLFDFYDVRMSSDNILVPANEK